MLKATRPLAAPTKAVIEGATIEFLDGWHLELFRYGKRCVERGAHKGTRAPLWEHFNGYIANDPEWGLPFNKAHHVDFAAMQAYDLVESGNWDALTTLVDGSAINDYLRRNIRNLCDEFLGD